MNENFEAVREYVAAHAAFVHYVEMIHGAISGVGSQHHGAEPRH